MEIIIDNLTPETIAYIEQAYGSMQSWISAAANWTAEQFEALHTVIIEDIHI